MAPVTFDIYAWNSATSAWEQQGADIDGEAADDYSGFSVSLSSDGTTVAIGAYGNDGNGSNSGHVRIYAWNSATSAWEQQGADIDGEAADDNSGYSVSLSSDGTTVAIGAPNNDGNGSYSGHVRIYAWNSATSAWEQQGADIDGEAADDYSGWSVSLSSDGTTVAIGAPWNDGNGSAPVTFVFTHGIALQVLGNSKALTSTAKRRVIRAAIAFPFPPTARRLPLGRMVTTATALTPVTFVFTHGIALQVLGNSKALTSTAKRRMMLAAGAFPFPPTARRLPLGRLVTTATALTPVTFVFTHGIALQVLGNSKALTSTAKRRVIGAAGAFPFPPTARRLPLGRLITTATALTPVTCGCTLFRVLRLLKAALMRTRRTIILKRQVDDGSCIIYGCPFTNACNYDPDATQR